MSIGHSTSVIPRTISQDMRKIKYIPKKKNIMNRNKKMTTHHIILVNQAISSQPINYLMTRKASLPE